MSDTEPAILKAAIMRDRAAEVARADYRYHPFLIDLQHSLQALYEELYLISRSLLAEAAKVRQVLADLSRTDIQPPSQFMRRGDLLVFLLQSCERAQI